VSFLSAAERFASIDRSEIVLYAQQCLHSHNQFSTCDACFEICPVEAIEPAKPPALDANKCQACLACLPVCPAGAYSADDAVQPLLTCVARLETKTVELVCALHEKAGMGTSTEATGIRVRGCLAGLGVGTYLALAAMGLERIILRLDACGGCPWASLRDRISVQVDQASRMLVQWEIGSIFLCIDELDERAERPLWDANNPPLSRRDLFRMAARQGQVAMARVMSQDQMKAGRHLGRDRSRINNAVAHLPKPKMHLDLPVNEGDFAMLSVSEECNACSACARACPTDALTFHVNDEKTYYQLNFDPQACIGCDACVDVCAPEAIEIDKSPSFIQVFGSPEPLVLRDGELSQCVGCKTLFAAKAGQELCPVCFFRRINPFGSRMPPGIKLTGKRSGGTNA
jgi:ferredoxin